MGRPKGLYRTLEEAIREYERHHGCVVDRVLIGTDRDIPIVPLHTLKLLTRRAHLNYDTVLDGAGIYVCDEKRNRWVRACLVPRGHPQSAKTRIAWLRGQHITEGWYEPEQPKLKESTPLRLPA